MPVVIKRAVRGADELDGHGRLLNSCLAAERAVGEHLIDREQSYRETLLVRIARHRFERAPVRLVEAVRPEVVAHQRAGIVVFRVDPGQPDLQRRGLGKLGVGQALGLRKSLVDAGGEPGVLVGTSRRTPTACMIGKMPVLRK